MPRRKGQREASYEIKRKELLSKLRERLALKGAPRPSWRELASAGQIGLATLKHYFGKRDEVVIAVMRDDLERGAKPITVLSEPAGSFKDSVAAAINHIAAGFEHGGVSRIYAVGLIEGLGHPVLGPGFIETILEPGISALQTRLQSHVDSGEMRQCDTRQAAITLISPLIIVFLHQKELDGASGYFLDIDKFIEEHIRNFIAAFRSE